MAVDPHQVGKRLTEIRELQARSLSEVAEAAGVAKSYLLKLERGEVENPGLGTLDAVAKALKVTLAKLVAPTGPGAGRPAPREAWESVDARMSPSLQEFVRLRELQGEKISADMKRTLASIRFRGAQPERPDGWELIYLAIKRGIDRP